MTDQGSESPKSPLQPPVTNTKDAVLDISKKRSHEDISKDGDDFAQNFVTVKAEAESMDGLPQSHTARSHLGTNPGSQQMPPPPVPAEDGMRAPTKPPQSGQGSQRIEQSQTGSTQMMSSLNIESRSNRNEAETGEDDIQSSNSPPGADSDVELEAFDWVDLEQRYHDKVSELQMKEDGIMEEFGALCNYFDIWAQAGSQHEVERSFKRMRTQMTMVQQHEDQLEQKRQHYMQVVNAFKSALDLLAR